MSQKSNRVCSVEGCGKKSSAKGYCHSCYEKTPDRIAYKKAQYLKTREHHLAVQREWYHSTKEYQKERTQKYRMKNKDQILAKGRAKYHANIPAQRARYRRYYPEHKNGYVARTALRRSRQLQRTPPWADLDQIAAMYKNCPKGFHVDHIIPLNGKNVSGLHTIDNLQYLPGKENLCKSNKFEVVQGYPWPR